MHANPSVIWQIFPCFSIYFSNIKHTLIFHESVLGIQWRISGSWLDRALKVQLQPLILGVGCMHRSNFWPDTSFPFFV